MISGTRPGTPDRLGRTHLYGCAHLGKIQSDQSRPFRFEEFIKTAAIARWLKPDMGRAANGGARGGRAVSTMHMPGCGGAAKRAAKSEITAGVRNLLSVGLSRLARDTRGSTAIEYALIGSLIFLVAAGSIRLYANRMSGVYNQISTAVAQTN